MTPFCPLARYKALLGTPNEGVHKHKFLGTSVVDYLLTLVAASLTTYFTRFPLVLSTIVWFVLGIVSHVLFGVRTEATQFLGVGRC
jgi:hypothetical protein